MSLTQAVLVVDDSPSVITLVDETLRSDYLVRVASSGPMALAILERYPEVDLILLDVMMPDMDGFEVCRRIKETSILRDIPLIFLTSRNENQDEAYGLSLGAVDYITKPVEPATLRARVNTHTELCRIRRELQKKNELLNAERNVIEGMILRMRADPHFDDRGIRWLMRPVERTNGDICLAAYCQDGRQLILVGDFTGHGLTAAIGGSSVKQAFYALCREGASLADVVTHLNDLLHAQLLDTQFMAAVIVEVSPKRNRVQLWAGGMREPLYAKATGQILPIPLHGFPLGLMQNWDITSEVCTLEVCAGERLLFYTDGSVESMNAAGECYETDRLVARYASLLQRGEPLSELIVDLDLFVAGVEQMDDQVFLELNL